MAFGIWLREFHHAFDVAVGFFDAVVEDGGDLVEWACVGDEWFEVDDSAVEEADGDGHGVAESGGGRGVVRGCGAL